MDRFGGEFLLKFEHVKRYMQSGQIRQRLAEFAEATARPRRWAETAEALLTAPLDCRQPQLAHRRQEAQELLAELPDVEAGLKTAGKLIQLLGEDVSPEKQQEMTQTLRELRESVSDGQAGCQQQADVCAQSADRLAAAGRGQAEVFAWLDELSKLLDGPAPATETVLSRQLYCRSLLDSTTKIVSGLLEAARAVPALDTTQLEREQAAVSGRFAELTAGAERMQQAAERGVTEWLELPTVWKSADQLADSRQQQQRAVQRLEEQRPRVLAAVQRGRDLSRDLSQAPALLPEALEQLELVWAESNAEVIQRLDSATETERLWTELADRRADLQCALATHRSALDAAADTAEPGPALAELAAHVQTQQPERAQQMQQRLQQIAQQLGGRLAPEAAQQLKQQVDESDADVAAVSEQLQQKMDNLTSAAQTWAQVSDRVEVVRLGLQSAQRSQQRLSTLDMPPETRRQQLQLLTQQLQQHAEERQQLNELMDTLQSEGYDGGQFRSELAILGDTLQHMSEAAAQQRAVLEDEYKHWHTYQEQVGELVPWLDWAEEKVAADLPRPAELEEAAQILQQCQHFEDQVCRQGAGRQGDSGRECPDGSGV
ncbi:microtubule-actin cross-linking factor 1-like [Amphibalanus amphitrite]|uniref:microtubule-actin cross-linking factor 1-like n=1 Tax=Amphibalanus amphitrite TaxID=1232801 RepID=UPI001C8FE52E|nr:microtubule-actin cross-linking factor 1-like [Amphibalanus amphitrite]